MTTITSFACNNTSPNSSCMSSSTTLPSSSSSSSTSSPASSSSQCHDMRLIPLADLNPYTAKQKWMVRVRVVVKSDVKTYTSNRGGRLFSFVIEDDKGTKMRITCFNLVVDKFFSDIVLGGVYNIAKGAVKHTKIDRDRRDVDNDYEMTLNTDSIVEPVKDEGDMPKLHVNLQPISSLKDAEFNASVDVLGIVVDVGQLYTVSVREGKEIPKLNLTIADQSGHSVGLTLWSEKATAFPATTAKDAVVLCKGVKLSSWDGYSLTTTLLSQILVHPGIDAQKEDELATWWRTDPSAQSITPIGNTFVPGEGSGSGSGSGGTSGEGTYYHEDNTNKKPTFNWIGHAEQTMFIQSIQTQQQEDSTQKNKGGKGKGEEEDEEETDQPTPGEDW